MNINEKKKIWVLDDDPSILDVIKIILEEENYSVTAISDVGFLREKMENDLPNLILLDVWMSGESGEEIAKFLKSNKNTKHIPIIMVSALSDVKKIAKETGVDGFLEKPFDINNLLEIVKKHI